jgi:hypothetical protein
MSNWLIVTDEWNCPAAPGVLQAFSGRRARKWIESPEIGIGRVILSPDTWDEDFVGIVRAIRRERPVTPVFLFQTESRVALPASLRIAGSMSPLQIEESLRNRNVDASERAPVDASEERYIGIPIEDFVDVDRVPMAVYIRISNGKLVRLLEPFEDQVGSRIRSYPNRGVTHLYVRREDHDRVLDEIDVFRESIHRGPSGDPGLRAAMAVSETLRLMSGLRAMEQLDRKFWMAIQRPLLQLRECIADPRVESRTWLKKCRHLDHCLSVLVISGLMGSRLQIEREEAFLKLAMAALFHDISLLNVDGIPFDEDPSRLKGERLNKFLQHPTMSAEYLSRVLRADPIIVQAVRNHHWRRDGSDFARSAEHRPHRVPILAEVLGIADEASASMLRLKGLPVERLPAQLEARFRQCFSPESVNAFLSMFRTDQ